MTKSAFIIGFLFTVGCSGANVYNAGDPASKAFLQTRILECFLSGCGSAPTITNLHQNGLIETGFVVGSAPSETGAVEVSVNGGAYQAASGTTSWSFGLPAGAATLRRHTSNVICARGLVNGLPTRSTCLTAVKSDNRDVNGDGFSDLLIGATTYDGAAGTDTGAFFIVYGRANGLSSGSIGQADVKLEGATAGDRLGGAGKLADVNGDGFADAIVAARNAFGTSGQVFVFSGSASGIASGTSAAAAAVITGIAAGDDLGEAIDAGDINGDNIADILISTTEPATQTGQAYVFFGSTAGISSNFASAAATTITGEATSERLGSYAVVDDFDNDGLMDYCVSARTYDANDFGRVYCFKGTPLGLGSVSAATANLIYTGSSASQQLSTITRLGDFNGDGLRDLSIGTRSQNRAYIILNSAGNFTSGTEALAAATFTNLSGGQFAEFSRLRDLNRDGFADLILGNNSVNLGAGGFQGGVYVYNGTASPVSLNDGQADNTIGGAAGGDSLAKMTVLDINGDGYQDLVMSSENAAASAGQVYIFLGGPAGLPASTTAASADITITGDQTTGAIGTSFD